jgi:hypothetical protein
VVGAETYSLGILEWSYGLDRPYIVHVLGGWEQFPFYNNARSAKWYDLGFVLGADSPILGSYAREEEAKGRLTPVRGRR